MKAILNFDVCPVSLVITELFIELVWILLFELLLCNGTMSFNTFLFAFTDKKAAVLQQF